MPEEPRSDSSIKKPVSILLVEDQEMLRLGVKLSLHGNNDLQLVGEASNGPDAVKLARSLKPDLILMDIGLPEFDGIVATRKIKGEGKSKVLILSSHGEDEFLYPSLEAGADGYCLKELSKEALLAAIRAVASGGTWLDETIARRVINAIHRRSNDSSGLDRTGYLSLEEKDLLNLLLEGKSTETISQELDLSFHDVHDLTRTVLQKIARKADSYEEEKEESRALTAEHKPAKRCRICHYIVPLELDYCPIDGEKAILDRRIGASFANRYEILSLLGTGSGGSVYKARHRYLNSLAAIKILHPDLMSNLDLLQRFRLEAATICSLNHPNIVTIKDFGISEEGDTFMIMEYFAGKGLDQILEEQTALEFKKALEIFLQICDGMQTAHEKGILHRDLKPSNILIQDTERNTVIAKVADFGTAKIIKGENAATNNSFQNLTRTHNGQVLGTPLYMSPEQCQSRSLGPTSDIYSLGCLMYQCLSGEPPIQGNDYMDVMYRHVYESPKNLADTACGNTIPRRLEEIVMSTLQKDSTNRPQTMRQLASLMSGALQ